MNKNIELETGQIVWWKGKPGDSSKSPIKFTGISDGKLLFDPKKDGKHPYQVRIENFDKYMVVFGEPVYG